MEARGIRIGVLVSTLWLTAVAWGEPSRGLPEMAGDAELTDVAFLDLDRGWAVGDRGTIWRTEDGGRNWRLQESPLACRWESVHFLDERNGWIVGGWIQPYTGQSRGAILRTRDGGQNWMPVPSPTLPALRRVRFLDERRGWAFGASSAMYPAGVFQTEDGGRSWSPVPQGQGVSWLTGDVRRAGGARGENDDTGSESGSSPSERRGRRGAVVAGSGGRLGLVTDAEVLLSEIPAAAGRVVRDLRLADAKNGWLVGDGGLLLQTRDGGLGWLPPAATPLDVRYPCDWSALAVLDSRCWVAGAPGSCVLYSGDEGRSWEVFRTGQSLPLRAMTFLDEHHGWAVGTLGTILATRDGGRTWRRQRGGGRAAVLGVFADEQQLPLELFAQLSGTDGYLGVAEILFTRAVGNSLADTAHSEACAQEAMLAVGASGARLATRFPAGPRGASTSAEALIERWEQTLGPGSLEQLDAHLVRLIRQWRPEILVTEETSRTNPDPLTQLTRQLLLQAVQRAGEPQTHAEQIAREGLEPWRVKKVFALLPNDERGTLNLTTTQLSPRFGRSLGEVASSGRGWLTELTGSNGATVGNSASGSSTASGTTLGFRLLVDQVPQDLGRRDFLSGHTLTAAGEGRREGVQAARADVAELSRAAQKQRNLQQLLLRSSGNVAQTAAWLGQLEDLTRGMNKSAAGEVYWQLAQRYRQAGQLDLAAETFQQLVRRDPQHELSDAALLWLFQYHSSGELAWQRERALVNPAREVAGQAGGIALTSPARRVGGKDGSVEPAAAPEPLATSSRLVGPRESNDEPTQVRPAAAIVPLGGDSRSPATVLAESLERTRPALAHEPAVRFPLAALHRRSGRWRDAEPIYRQFMNGRAGADWSAVAQMELWLQAAASGNGRTSPPNSRRMMRVASAASRPRLDGRLDDEVWRSAARLVLAEDPTAEESSTATAWFAYDDQYVYLAATCRKVAGRAYPRDESPRPRDADLRNWDRVEFLIDTDRDGATAYRLAIDQRGWTFESCWNDASWNPTWYVAAEQTESDWIVEAAIAREDLVARPLEPHDAWGVQVRRVTPGFGVPTWPAAGGGAARPETTGWIVFE